jgi:hypothetical protein
MSVSGVVDPTMSYEGLVEAGREARKQADSMQWTEGDLALQVQALTGNERPRDPETGDFIKDEERALQRYAEDVDIPYSTVRSYRITAQAWPSRTRDSAVPYKVHEILVAQPDRFDLIEPGMTTREAQRIVRQRTSATTGKPGWQELLGQVGDSLIKAEKELTKVEEEMGDKTGNAKDIENGPHPNPREK